MPAGLSSAMAPPDFGRSVNPISSRGADYTHQIILATRIFRPSCGPACNSLTNIEYKSHNDRKRKLKTHDWPASSAFFSEFLTLRALMILRVLLQRA